MKNKKGSALVITLIILGIVSTISLSLALVSARERRAAIGVSKTGISYQTADEGAEKVMYDILKSGGTTVGNINNCTGGLIQGAGYKVALLDEDGNVINCNSRSSESLSIVKSIKSVGTSPSGNQNTQRSVKMPVASNCFTSDIDELTYCTVLGADGKYWLDRNLGATEAATAYNDTASYGYLYQWGRGFDGHQIVRPTPSGVAAGPSSSPTPGTNFLTMNSGTVNWYNGSSPALDALWQGVSGTNNPCPAGFRLPTKAEWKAWTDAAGLTNCTTNCREAFANSALKIPTAGYRRDSDAGLYLQGSLGLYWSSSPYSTNAVNLNFNSGAVVPANINGRALGFSVRCIKD